MNARGRYIAPTVSVRLGGRWMAGWLAGCQSPNGNTSINLSLYADVRKKKHMQKDRMNVANNYVVQVSFFALQLWSRTNINLRLSRYAMVCVGGQPAAGAAPWLSRRGYIQCQMFESSFSKVSLLFIELTFAPSSAFAPCSLISRLGKCIKHTCTPNENRVGRLIARQSPSYT